MSKDKAWMKEEIWKQDTVMNKGYIYTDDLMSIINELDEPEKVVVPQFVADYIEQSKKDNDSINQAFTFIDDKENKELWNWLFPSISDEKRANQEVFMRAWLDGYTIEKEPQWVVKDDTGYLSYLQFSIPNIYERETSLDKNGAYKFNSKSKADLIADLITGTVEEVAE